MPMTRPILRQLLRLALLIGVLVAALPATAAPRPPDPPPLHPITPDHGQLWLTGQPFELRAINYTQYSGAPPGCPELHFGADQACPWNQAAIEADMAQLAALGVNGIRIFLNYYIFGGARAATPAYDPAPALAHLDALIAAASRQRIYVLPVLLAKFPQQELTPAGYEQAATLHVRPLVSHLAARPGLIAWDLFNEPDLAGPIDQRCWDWDNGAFPLCLSLANERLAFLALLSAEVRALDPGRPLTIGAGFAKNYFRPLEATARMADLVDIYSFHYYDNDPYDSGRYAAHWYYGAGFPADLQRAVDELTALGPRKPVLVTELGFPSGAGSMRDEPTRQHDLRLGLQTARQAGAAGVALWPFQSNPGLLVGDLFSRPQ